VTSLSGKSIKNPPSAMGVQRTKNDQVRRDTKIPCSIPYLNAIKRKYNINIDKMSKNFLSA
jgi:hypothetical protein